MVGQPMVLVGAAVAGVAVGLVVGIVLGKRVLSDGADTAELFREPASELGVEATRQAVVEEIRQVTTTTDRIVRGLEMQVNRNAPPVSRLQAVADAAERNEIGRPDPSVADGRADDGPRDEEVAALEEFVDVAATVQQRQEVDSADASRLLRYLTDPPGATRDQFRETLTTTVERLDEATLVTETVPDGGTRDPERAAETVQQRLRGVDGSLASGVSELASGVSELASDLEACQSARNDLQETVGRMSAVADNQTSLSMPSSPMERARTLAEALDDGTVELADASGRVADVATAAKRSTNPESRLGRELLDGLSDQDPVDDDFRTLLEEVTRTLDETETVRGRLSAIDREQVARLAADLADDLQDSTSPVESYLFDRVSDLADAIERASEADTLSVYAIKQELRYYDRTLIPQLRSDTDHDTADAESTQQLLTDVENRRSTMRTQYPSNYPEYNHNIPIHYLELVGELHEQAKKAAGRGEHQRALGTLKAADQILDWTEQLYERHAYSALLQQLRG